MNTLFTGRFEINDTAEEVERQVLRFLAEAARPEPDYRIWHRAHAGGPDSIPGPILYSRKLGLLVLTVKDWTLDRITSYTPFEFVLQDGGSPQKRPNPDKEVRGTAAVLAKLVETLPEFRPGEPAGKRPSRIPVAGMVVFPHILRDDYCTRGLQWIIPPERVLFKDDLADHGEILRDPSGGIFLERISGAFPFPFRGLAREQEERLTGLIGSDPGIRLPPREGSGKRRFQEEVRALDEAQARLALRLGHGHRIIKGPPGSGKTLVLLHRCRHLLRYDPRVGRILMVCYNIALVSYLRRIIRDMDLPAEGKVIEVCHFFEVCSKILGEPIRYENRESPYYDGVIRETLDRAAEGKSLLKAFDAVLIDEGQDFSADMLRILLSVLRPGADLVISLDSLQDLYTRSFSWRSLGIRASGRTYPLTRVYRNTIEIFNATQRFIGRSPGEKRRDLLPDDFEFHGGNPELLRFRSMEEIESFLVEDIHKGVDLGEYRRSEIAIIYDDKIYRPERFDYDNRAFPMRILERLTGSGIPTVWVSRDVRAKETFDISGDRISLISIHSAKGLDFDLVYLMGVDQIHPTDRTLRKIVALLYVAMTRAKYRLVIPYVEETEMIGRIMSCLPPALAQS